MSAGTRKKFVDFHKILEDKLIDDFSPERSYNEKLPKHSKSRKLLGKPNRNAKSHHPAGIKSFLGKKRKPDGHLQEYEPLSEYRHKLKSKIHNKKNEKSEHNKKYTNKGGKILIKPEIQISGRNSIPQNEAFRLVEYAENSNNTNLNTNYSNLNKKIWNNLQRKSKFKDKFTKISKNEYRSILSQHIEELARLGIDFPRNEQDLDQEIQIEENGEKKEDACSLVSDFSSLYLTLFDFTKFENSKPHKMIDYILNNDNNFLLNQADKDKFEEMKRHIFNKSKLSVKDNITGVFKSLYEYFKTDFSVSVITKVFEKLNCAIQDHYDNCLNKNKDTSSSNNLVGIYQNILQNQRENDNISFIFDKKDKFTYQSFLTERLKSRNELLMEINDTDIIKSLVYLNNKGNKTVSRQGKGKGDNKFINLLKEKFESIESDANICGRDKKQLKMKLLGKKKFASFVKRKMKSLLAQYSYDDNSNENENEHSEESLRRTFNRMLELLIKHKEDDFDKILKSIKKNENLNPVQVKNIKSIWSTFKFLFYLVSLSSKEEGVFKKVFYLADDTFWQILLRCFNTNGSASPKIRFRAPGRAFSSETKKNDDDNKTHGTTSEIFSLSNNTNTPLDAKQIVKSNKVGKFFTASQEKKAETNSNAIFECEKVKADIKAILLSKLEKREEVFKVRKKEQNKEEKMINSIEDDMKDIRNHANQSEEKPKSNRRKKKKVEDGITADEVKFENNSDHNTNKSISMYSDTTEKVVIKPKTVRPIPGFNATSGNIIINNYYNIINQNITEPAAIALVQNLAQMSKGEITDSSSMINIVQYNTEQNGKKSIEKSNSISLSTKPIPENSSTTKNAKRVVKKKSL